NTLTVAHGDVKREFTDQPAVIGTFKDYFSMVPYIWLAGNKETVFSRPDEIVLSASRAKVYFPNLDAQELLGRVLQIDSVNNTIKVVIKDIEKTSKIRKKVMVPVKDADLMSDNWYMVNSNH